MTQEEFIRDNITAISTKLLNKIDRCGVVYWELFSPAEKLIAMKRRGCDNCALKRKEDDFCYPAGKAVSDLPVFLL